MKNTAKILMLFGGLLLCASSWAGECEVMLSRPDINLGNLRGTIPDEQVFAPVYDDVAVSCDGTGPVRIKLEGLSATAPGRYSLGAAGTLALNLADISLQGNRGGRLRVQVPGKPLQELTIQGEHPLSDSNMRSMQLPPESELTVLPGAGSTENVRVSMRLRAELPTDKILKGLRDKTALNGQILVRASQ